MTAEKIGILSPITRFTSGTINKVKLNRASTFSIARNVETLETSRAPDCSIGPAFDSAVVEQRVTYELSYVSPAFDEASISEFFDQQITEGNTTAIGLPTFVCQTLTTANAPGGTLPYAALTLNETIQVNVNTQYTQEMLTQVTAAPAAANEFQVTAGNVVFDASQVDAGKTASISRTADQTPLKYIGGPAPAAPYGAREFYGVIQGLAGDDPWHIWFPSALPTGNRSLDTGADSTTFTYRASTPSGFSFPYLAWQLPFSSVIP